MPAHSEIQLMPYTTRQLFDMVIDIERYPDFLPWCRAARIIQRDEGGFLGELVISFSALTESYTSRITPTPPIADGEPAGIDVVMVKGPFEYLTNRWRFTRLESGQGTKVDFFLDFKFRSRLLEKLMGGLFAKANARMVGAFKARADALYGGRP